MSTLPREVSALVHYLTLNEAGWWDRALTQVLLGCLRRSREPMSVERVSQELRDLGAHVSAERLEAAIEALEADDLIVRTGDTIRLSPSAVRSVDDAVDAADAVDAQARERFDELLTEHGVGLDADRVWRTFLDGFLIPVVSDLGARTLRLLAMGADGISGTQSLRDFLREHPDHLHDVLSRVVVDFLDPRNEAVRALVRREMHTHLLLRALALDESSLGAARAALSERPEFHLFLDTNFLFSALHLHDNPSNDAAEALMEVIADVDPGVEVHLYVHPHTVREAVNTLKSYREQLRDLRLTPGLSEAAASVEFSGVALTFVRRVRAAGQPIAADDYFRPYISDLPKLLEEQGIQVVGDESPEVIEDRARRDFNELLRNGDGRLGRKTEGAWIHDLQLRRSVAARRPRSISTPLSAGWWMVTLDQNLIRFDEQRTDASDVPVCIPPAVVIDLFQFWVPANPELHEAVVSGVRAFATGSHDAEAEEMAHEILRVLSRFESVDDLPPETLVDLLTDMALGARITREGVTDDEKVELVREALVQEVKDLRWEIERFQTSHAKLEAEIEREVHGRAIAQKKTAQQAEEIEKLQGRLEAEEQAYSDLEQRLNTLETVVKDHDDAQSASTRRRARSWFCLSALTALVAGGGAATLAVASIAGYWWDDFERALGPTALGSVIVWSGLVARSGRSRPNVDDWRVFRAFDRVAGNLWALSVAVVVEIVIVLVALGGP